MNPTTKTWLLDVLDKEEVKQRRWIADAALIDRASTLANLLRRIEDARLLVEQGPEEPAR